MNDEALPVVFNNSDREDFTYNMFDSVLYGVLLDNPGSDVFYEAQLDSRYEKTSLEAYMADALDQKFVRGEIAEYDDPALARTASVLARPEIRVGAFDAGPVTEDEDLQQFMETLDELGQEIPEDLADDFSHGRSIYALNDERDEEFVDYVIDEAVNMDDVVVVKQVPSSAELKFEREGYPVHRANDQSVSQEELQKISMHHSPEL